MIQASVYFIGLYDLPSPWFCLPHPILSLFLTIRRSLHQSDFCVAVRSTSFQVRLLCTPCAYVQFHFSSGCNFFLRSHHSSLFLLLQNTNSKCTSLNQLPIMVHQNSLSVLILALSTVRCPHSPLLRRTNHSSL